MIKNVYEPTNGKDLDPARNFNDCFPLNKPKELLPVLMPGSDSVKVVLSVLRCGFADTQLSVTKEVTSNTTPITASTTVSPIKYLCFDSILNLWDWFPTYQHNHTKVDTGKLPTGCAAPASEKLSQRYLLSESAGWVKTLNSFFIAAKRRINVTWLLKLHFSRIRYWWFLRVSSKFDKLVSKLTWVVASSETIFVLTIQNGSAHATK